MEIGFYVNDEWVQKWYSENLPIAKKILSSLTNLNELVNNFLGYENKKYDMNCNFILAHALPDFSGNRKPQSDQILEDIDHMIEIFQINKITNGEYKNFRSKLILDDYQASSFALEELYIANELAVKIGLENIDLFPNLSNSNNVSDIKIKLNQRDVYFEVTNNGLSKPETIIFKIMDRIAKHIGPKIYRNDCFLEVIVDSAHLIRDDNKDIDEDASVEYFCNEADRLEIHKLAGFKGFFELSIAWLTVSFDEVLKGKKYQKKCTKQEMTL